MSLSQDDVLLTRLGEPVASLAEETAALKHASLAAEKILYSLLSLHPQEFEVLKDHGLTRSEIEETMNAALLARHRVTCAEAQTLESSNAQGVI